MSRVNWFNVGACCIVPGAYWLGVWMFGCLVIVNVACVVIVVGGPVWLVLVVLRSCYSIVDLGVFLRVLIMLLGRCCIRFWLMIRLL